MSGRVTVSGSFATKPDRQVDPAEPVEVEGPPPRFVSRGGEKLDAAIDSFGIAVGSKRFLDAGASTGGFTDCLLQRGASSVVAVDVGHGQLDHRLRQSPQVAVFERTHLRDLTPEMIGGRVDGAVVDVSFISLRRVLRPILDACLPGSPVVLLVKPQFEAGRQEAARGRGVIRDPAVWRRVLGEVNDAVVSEGASIMGGMVSPLRGNDGNVEFLLHVLTTEVGGHGQHRPPAGLSDSQLDDVVDQASVEDRG